tara:strand:- start:800 stop:1516 length:717 start_codon:yes stop_codon:yes gene_type:complete
MKTAKLTKRPAEERGHANHGWLDARFTFSFSEYFDPDHMGFRDLRVMNNDTINPGGGFPTHPHESMEIFTYVIEGQLEHRDSMGNGAVIKAGDLQYMSAGEGIRHSEFNPSSTEHTHLYQIWLKPNQSGGTPRYAEKPLLESQPENNLLLLFSGDGRNGSTEIRQDANFSFGTLDASKALTVPASKGHPYVWIQVISGELDVLGENLKSADGLAIEDVDDSFEIIASQDSKFFVFQLS